VYWDTSICSALAVYITGAALPNNNDASAELTTANGGTLLQAQPDSVANHVIARLISIDDANMSENFIHQILSLYVHIIYKNM